MVLLEAELENKLAKFEGRTASQVAAAVSTHGGAIAKMVQEQVVRLVEARFTQKRGLTTANCARLAHHYIKNSPEGK